MKRRRYWTDAILDHWDAGVDVSQIEERLRMTPEERLDTMLRFLRLISDSDGQDSGNPSTAERADRKSG